jgi:hypothetical protein
MKGFGPHAESGVKNGEDSEVGLVGPAENEDGAVSVKTLDNEKVGVDSRNRKHRGFRF